MTRLYLAGGEVPSHRKLMTTLEVPNVALSYMGLRRRVKFARPWLLHDKFLEGQEIFLDSGAHTVNQGDDKHSQKDLEAIGAHYLSFVDDNLDRLALVSEFDALPLGRDWITAHRADFSALAGEKFLPIWHPQYGLDNLNQLADEYLNIGVTATGIDGRDLTPILNKLAEDNHLHGVGITSVDDMYAIKWHSLSSTSWMSPQQYGDTIIWTGRELKRYPKKYKEQARKRFRTMFEREGFDSEKIEADDSNELLRLSIWSWQRLMDDIDKKRPSIVTNPPEEASEPNVEVGGEVVDMRTGEVRKSVTTTPVPVVRRDPVPLPVLGITTSTETVTNDAGETKEVEVRKFGLRSESERRCSSCYLASKCPAFDADSNCAYNIPVTIKTRDQLTSVQDSIIEMQTQRVAFLRFAEEIEGGYADPNLSAEIDRLQKMIKTKVELEEEGLSLKVDLKAKGGGAGGAGMLSRLFGTQASETARALPAPISADSVIDVVVEGDWTES